MTSKTLLYELVLNVNSMQDAKYNSLQACLMMHD